MNDSALLSSQAVSPGVQESGTYFNGGIRREAIAIRIRHSYYYWTGPFSQISTTKAGSNLGTGSSGYPGGLQTTRLQPK
jgi:hypothetical protein